MRIVDLSFPIKPHFRWKALSERPATHAAGDPLQSTVMTISCHAYTHVDAPLHFLADGRDIAAMPIDQWIGDAAVVDLTHLGEDGEVSAVELEKHAGHVRAGDIVLPPPARPPTLSVARAELRTPRRSTRPSGSDRPTAKRV